MSLTLNSQLMLTKLLAYMSRVPMSTLAQRLTPFSMEFSR